MFEWFQEGTNIGFGMILRPLKLATWLELLKDLEKKKKDGMVFTVLHFDFLVKWELVNFEANKVESFNLLLDRNKMEKWDKIGLHLHSQRTESHIHPAKKIGTHFFWGWFTNQMTKSISDFSSQFQN